MDLGSHGLRPSRLVGLLVLICSGCVSDTLVETPAEDPCPGGALQPDGSCAACGLDSCRVASGLPCGLLPDPCGTQIDCPCPDDERCGNDGLCAPVPVDHCEELACLAQDGHGGLCRVGCSAWERVESIFESVAPDEPTPDFRIVASLAYQPSATGPGTLVLFGGTRGAGEGWLSLADSWLITAEPDPSPACESPCVRWRRATGAGPPTRSSGKLASGCGALWLFGGAAVLEPIGLGERGVLLDDLWRRDGAGWEELFPVAPNAPWPAARSEHLLGFDEARSELVLFGGEPADGETWTAPCPAPGATVEWTRHLPDDATPTQPGTLASAWDPNLGPQGELRVYGRETHAAWTGSGWRALAAHEPGPLGEVAMAFEPAAPPAVGRMVLHGGSVADGPDAYFGIAATWEAVGEGPWTQRATPESAGRVAWQYASMAYFPELHGLFLTAGSSLNIASGGAYLLGPPLR